MQRKFLAISCLVLLLSVGLYSFAYRGKPLEPEPTEQQSSAKTVTNSQSDSLSSSNDEYIAYRHVFAHIYSESRDKEKSNQEVNAAIELYRYSVPLSEDEANVLTKIALETETKTLAIEEQAMTIIKRFREKLDAEMKSRKKPSPEPPELQTLQQQRVDTTLRGRDELRKAFGDSTFLRFDKFLKEGLNLRIQKAIPSPQNN
jgi:hypothetical protein